MKNYKFQTENNSIANVWGTAEKPQENEKRPRKQREGANGDTKSQTQHL